MTETETETKTEIETERERGREGDKGRGSVHCYCLSGGTSHVASNVSPTILVLMSFPVMDMSESVVYTAY